LGFQRHGDIRGVRATGVAGPGGGNQVKNKHAQKGGHLKKTKRGAGLGGGGFKQDRTRGKKTRDTIGY